ncbi:hypothetical protein K490DRAFT_47324 [Saccharata proteae CBS 121410]|uniref:Glutaredoxin-like protein n=1 Tax=Saccharata proteae CBS 121410 TaxID=1314787 RepID=A0A9P4LXN9_9PEZI|nr:hypothetical protein K490DRAFT_47324 [Saccharata proteae CBS 121410]
MFSPTRRLLHQACRVTLFTRQGCGLCDNAKATLMKVQQQRPFEYEEIDVMAPGKASWKLLYELDVPVAHIGPVTEKLLYTPQENKLWHRFDQNQIKAALDRIEKSQSGNT